MSPGCEQLHQQFDEFEIGLDVGASSSARGFAAAHPAKCPVSPSTSRVANALR